MPNDKLTPLGSPGDSLVSRRKIGGSALHQRVAAQPLPPTPQPLTEQAHRNGVTQFDPPVNPYDTTATMTNRIGMMLDRSSSMAGREGDKTKMEHMKEACRNFIQNCDFTDTAIALDTFPEMDDDSGEGPIDWSDHTDPNDPLAHLLPKAPPKVKTRGKKRQQGLCNIEAFLQADIDSMQEGGCTPLTQSMERTFRNNSLTRGIIVSDGEADQPGTALTFAQQWKQADIPIDTVHIGHSTCGESLLRNIAEITGGVYIKFDNVANFAKNFKYLTPAFRGMLTSGSAGMLGAKEVK